MKGRIIPVAICAVVFFLGAKYVVEPWRKASESNASEVSRAVSTKAEGKGESASDAVRKRELESDLKDPVFVAAGRLQLAANRAIGSLMRHAPDYYQMYKSDLDRQQEAVAREFNSYSGTKTSKIGVIVNYAKTVGRVCDNALASESLECGTLKRNLEEFSSLAGDYR